MKRYKFSYWGIYNYGNLFFKELLVGGVLFVFFLFLRVDFRGIVLEFELVGGVDMLCFLGF